jgi:hypothetical protein
MIAMLMGKDVCIQVIDVFPEHLNPEIRAAIYNECVTVDFNHR